MSHRRRLCALFLGLLLCRASLARPDISDWKNVQDLSPESGIAVRTKQGQKYHGDLLRVTADALTLNSDERGFPGRMTRQRDLQRADIQQVRLLAPAASLLAGAAIGGGVGAGLGAIADASAKSNEDRGLVTGTLAILGAALGAGIAHHNPIVKGRAIYVAR